MSESNVSSRHRSDDFWEGWTLGFVAGVGSLLALLGLMQWVGVL